MKPYFSLLYTKKTYILFILSFFVYFYIAYETSHFELINSNGLNVFFTMQYPARNFLYNISLIFFTFCLFSTKLISMNQVKTQRLIVIRQHSLRSMYLFHLIAIFCYMIIVNILLLIFIHLFCDKISLSILFSTSDILYMNRILSFNNMIMLIIYILLSTIGYTVFMQFIFILFSQFKNIKLYVFCGLCMNIILFYGIYSISTSIFLRQFHSILLFQIFSLFSITNITNPFMYNIMDLTLVSLDYTPIFDYFMTLFIYILITFLLFKFQKHKQGV